MEREIKVSVIIPVYNVETYISKCISSVIEQSYKNIEIILIDDGSKDSSGKILDEYEKGDDRITVIHQKNKGVSAARNRGLELASGDYVVFVDGDDWVDSNYVSYFVELLQNHECEIGMNVNNYTAISNKSSDNTYKISSEKAMEWLYLDKIFVAVWNKIYDMQFLKRNRNEKIRCIGVCAAVRSANTFGSKQAGGDVQHAEGIRGVSESRLSDCRRLLEQGVG